MKSNIGFTAILLLAAAWSAVAQVGSTLTVHNDIGNSLQLTFGLHPSATNGLDAVLGEAELPPTPPTLVFDARFVGDDLGGVNLGQGSLRDYRQGDLQTIGERVHELKFQMGRGTTVTIAWNMPTWAVGRLQDIITGTLIDVPMNGAGSYTVTDPQAFQKLKMSITYEAPLPIQLLSFSALYVEGGVRLDWCTLSEVDNYGFVLQRREENAPAFADLANSFVPGHGTTNVPHDYTYTDASAPPGSWFYRLKQMDLDGSIHLSDAVHVDVLTDVNEGTPVQFELQQNYPNPFNPETHLGFGIGDPGPVSLKVYDLLGREVAILVDEVRPPGAYVVPFNGSSLPSGVYFYVLRSGAESQVKTFVLLR